MGLHAVRSSLLVQAAVEAGGSWEAVGADVDASHACCRGWWQVAKAPLSGPKHNTTLQFF
jgi:hypothetical protein